jgi:methionyl-tRNA formyltransferase
LNVPRLGWVNAHFSRLPAWRGAAPVQYAIAAGDEQISVTTFRIEAGLDTGPILLRSEPVAIEAGEDSGALLQRLAPVGAELMVRTLDELAKGSLVPEPQDDAGACLAPQITPADARIDWTRPVVEIERWVRACTPAPGAWTTVDGSRLGIGPARSIEFADEAVPGRFIVDRKQVRVGANGGYLVLGEVRPQGKKAMAADSWARGIRGDFPDAV